MSLAPHDERTLAEIETQLRTSDPWLAEMLTQWRLRTALRLTRWWHTGLSQSTQILTLATALLLIVALAIAGLLTVLG